jgi:hypothetical protein
MGRNNEKISKKNALSFSRGRRANDAVVGAVSCIDYNNLEMV